MSVSDQQNYFVQNPTTFYLCSGQGSQSVGMARDLFEKFELAKTRFAQADEILGFDLASVCFDGPEDALRQTRTTQPALYVHSVIVGELLRDFGIEPSATAGHSLGEYSALACAQAFDFETGLQLVKVRAQAMQVAGEQRPGTMAAVVGISNETVEQVCRDVASVGIVVPANYNSPGQLVISGEVSAVEKAMELCKTAGAKLVRKLVVSGAFHSPLMGSAAEQLGAALQAATISAPKIPVLANATGKPHGTSAEIKSALSEQLLSPVRWTDCLNELSLLGPDRWFELGPGNVLAGLLKRTVNGASASTVGTVTELEAIASGATI